MISMSPYYNEILQYFGFFSWKDPVEIVFFSWIIYHFSLWLKESHTKPLLPIFYGFGFLVLGSHFFNFSTMSSFLLLYAPVMIMLAILVHQESLQQNFVTLKKIKPITVTTKTDWLEILIRTCLRISNAEKSVICVIEQSEDLALQLDAPFFIKTPINDQLLSLLLESPHLHPQKMVWLDKYGMLIAVNSSWKKKIDQTWLTDELKKHDPWVAEGLMITQKNDTLVFKCRSGTFDVIAQGKLVENLSATNALRIIRHYLNFAPDASKQKGDTLHEIPNLKKPSLDQPHH